MAGERYRRPLQYAIIGAVGFAVDAGVLTVLVTGYGHDPVLSRGPSFIAAVSITWLLNRSFTFATRRHFARSKEYRRYMTSQCLGALANLLIYVGLVATMPALGGIPVVPLGVGACVGLLVNYHLSATWVFPERS